MKVNRIFASLVLALPAWVKLSCNGLQRLETNLNHIHM